MAPHLPDADRPSHAAFDGQTWDLPASDAIRLHVMWPLTPAGRQHLAFVEERCRTYCVRASKNSPPLRCVTFRGSIPHPMQQLCTLRVRHCCRLTQHSLPGGPLRPYLGRTFHRLDRTSFGWRLLTRSRCRPEMGFQERDNMEY